MINKIIDSIIFILEILFCLIFLITLLPHVETTKSLYSSIGLMSIMFYILSAILVYSKILKVDKINIKASISLIMIGGVMINNLFWKEDWKTQQIIYKHERFSYKTIEIQIKDKEEIVDNQRVIERSNYLNIIQKAKLIDTTIVEFPWIRIDEGIKRLEIQ